MIHESKSELVHLDVHIVPPGPDREFWFLFTTGMSALPMNAPAHVQDRYAELSILLPPTWRLDRASWHADSRWFWPIDVLRGTARLPHQTRTWLGAGTTIGGTDASQTIHPSTSFTSVLVLPAVMPEELQCVRVAQRVIKLFTLWPLYPDELQHKLMFGMQALLDQMELAEVIDIIDPDRPSALAPIDDRLS